MKITRVGLLMLFIASVANAQTAINPNLVEFTVSADHNATYSGGLAVVTGYEIRFYSPGATAPVSSSNLGKPAPDGTGKASVDISQLIVAFPIDPNIQYTAKVAAIGPAGEGVSNSSNPFLRAAPPQPASGVILVRR